MIRLKLVPIGDVPEKILNEIQTDLRTNGFLTYLEKPIEMPDESFSPYRHQYSGELILDILREIPGNVVGLITEDIYTGKKSFDFGTSEYDGPVVVSLYRLQPEFYKENPNLDLLVKRIVKQIIYYFGFTRGLKGCEDPRCVMHSVSSVNDIDMKSVSFCSRCKVILATLGVDLSKD